MSNIFRGTQYRYFQVPEFLFDGVFLKQLRPSSVLMYLVLLEKAQRYTRSALRVTNAEFKDIAALSDNSIRDARTELAEQRLLTVERGAAGVYTYLLCDPATGNPIPDPKARKEHAGDVSSGAAAGPNRTGVADSTTTAIEALSVDEKRQYFEGRVASIFHRVGNAVMVRCPLHNDTEASLHIDFEKGTWFCHGCGKGGGLVDFERALTGADRQESLRAVLDVIGRSDLFKPRKSSTAEAIYDYLDENAKLLFQVLRYRLARPRKFKARRPNGKGGWIWNVKGVRLVPYRLPELVRAKAVIVAEGEKDADRGKRDFRNCAPHVAFTTNPFGAGHWRDEFSPFFEAKDVALIPDNDAAGKKHVEQVAASVYAYAKSVRVVHLPGLAHGGDLSDYLDSQTPEDVRELIKLTSIWKPH